MSPTRMFAAVISLLALGLAVARGQEPHSAAVGVGDPGDLHAEDRQL